METRARYAMIGAFTLIVVFAAVGFVAWFSGANQRTERRSYYLVFNSSVSGLARGGLVLFNGLRVGEVVDLSLGSDPRQVIALIEIDPRTPVKTDTRARLEYQGLTGVASVALLGGSVNAPVLEGKGGGIAILFAEQSDYQNIVETLQTLAQKLDSVISKIDHLAGESSDSLSAIIHNVEAFSKVLADNSEGLSQTIDGSKNLVARLSASADKLDRLMSALVGPAGSKTTFDDLAEAIKSIRRAADALGPGLRQYESLASDGHRTLDDLNRTLRSFEKNPQQVLFGAKPNVPEYQGQ
jgi:phospholipid/cholesterol/gamma-HCH transport system substrate-binding protein